MSRSYQASRARLKLAARRRETAVSGYGIRNGRLVQVKPDGSVVVHDEVCEPLYTYTNHPASPFNTRGRKAV